MRIDVEKMNQDLDTIEGKDREIIIIMERETSHAANVASEILTSPIPNLTDRFGQFKNSTDKKFEIIDVCKCIFENIICICHLPQKFKTI